MKFVIAGTYQQFKHYYPKPDKNIIYLNSVEQVLGIKNWDLEKVGTWWDRDIEFLERVEAEYRMAQGATQ